MLTTTIKKRVARIKTLPLLALRGLVVFPEMVLHFDAGRKKSVAALTHAMEVDQTVFLVTQRRMQDEDPAMEDLYPVGVVAKIRQILRLPGEGLRVMVEGIYRARVVTALQAEPFALVTVTECLEREVRDPLRGEALVRSVKESFVQYAELYGKLSKEACLAVEEEENGRRLSDILGANLPLAAEEKQKLLSTLSVAQRLEMLLLQLEKECEILRLEGDIHQRVQEQMDDNQKDYYLREQMKAIAEELGESDNPLEEADAYRVKINALSLDTESKEKLLAECDKLAKMPPGNHEATVVRGYLDTVLSLPWGKFVKETVDIRRAKQVLDRDHYGLEKVKDRILEILAVRQLSPKVQGQVICLVGPPGVGKTSIARSVARAMGRPYARVSLGGVRDEADIRGHRKTYIGAMMGRILTAVKQAGCQNPLILLDEIDKMGNDFRGDPSSALLEVLDTAQNTKFVDHYVELPFDLSQVLFITTANDASAIPAPLFDRMDVIPLGSYTAEEKLHIAKEHLVRKQVKANGLTLRQVRFPDETLRELIDGYTREAGVRTLERQIGKICRQVARRIVEGEARRVTVTGLEEFLGPRRFKPDLPQKADEVGVVNGLAWTSVGGELLPVEVAVLEGTGKIELTGSLGDVMKESARIGISYVRLHAREWNIEPNFYKTKDIHIHAPEGAVPKDGPSAGIAMATAMISALTGIPVRRDVAMTGELSLRGRVLPIGGLKEKTMAAYTHHMRTVILPSENEPDLAEIDKTVREGLEFVPVEHLESVLPIALCRAPGVPAEPAAEPTEPPKMPAGVAGTAYVPKVSGPEPARPANNN